MFAWGFYVNILMHSSERQIYLFSQYVEITCSNFAYVDIGAKK